MTMKLKVSRFRIRKPDPVASPPLRPVAMAKPQQQAIADDAFMPDPDEDGFGDQTFLSDAKPATATTKPVEAAPQDIEAIRHEGLTGRQLRMARRLAQKHGLPATSDFDAVRLLAQRRDRPVPAFGAAGTCLGRG